MQYPYTTKAAEFKDENIMITVNFSNPTIEKPGEGNKPYTDTEAIAKKSDFMCVLIFDVEYVIKLRSNNKK